MRERGVDREIMMVMWRARIRVADPPPLCGIKAKMKNKKKKNISSHNKITKTKHFMLKFKHKL